MAVLVHLADQGLKALAASSAYPGAGLARAAHEFGDRELSATASIAELALGWIDGAHRIVTLSASGTVRAALTAAAGRAAAGSGHIPPVLVAESRPLLEGRDLAAGLALAGLHPTVVVDAAIRSLLRPGDLVLLGSDRIGWDGWVNKIGTRALVEGAAVTGVPVLVLAPSTRFLPEAVEGEPEGDRSGREVWENVPAGVALANPAFEAMTFAGVERVICEQGALTPADVVGRTVAIELDPRIVALRLHSARQRAAR
jgi:translation initiation factor 2B subunit (eIF-2B alpha/beta/delta family)